MELTSLRTAGKPSFRRSLALVLLPLFSCTCECADILDRLFVGVCHSKEDIVQLAGVRHVFQERVDRSFFGPVLLSRNIMGLDIS